MPDLAQRERRPSPTARPVPRRARRAAGSDELVVAVIRQHADSVLRLARSASICDDDANDAYQRALEIFVRHAHRLDPAKAASWLRTVAKHEAMAIRAQRLAAVDRDDVDLDGQPADRLAPPEEQVMSFERVARSAEALSDLKPDEVRALWLRAEGFSYAQIGERCGWTDRKVARLLVEGRARFLSRYATIEAGEACTEWRPVLSAIVDGESDVAARRSAGAHLRTCGACRATLRELRSSRPALRAVLPVGVALAGPAAEGHRAGLGGTLEGLFFGVHDRVAASMLKAQVAADALSAGKVAAITASVAAVAGGGVAAVEQTASRPTVHPKRTAVRTTRSAAAEPIRQAALPATTPTTPTATAAPAARTKSGTRAKTSRAAAEPSRARVGSEFASPSSGGGEFAQDRTVAAAPSAPAAAPHTEFSSPAPAASSSGNGEFSQGESGSAASTSSSSARTKDEFAP